MKDWRFLFEKFVLRQHKPYEAQVFKSMKSMHGKLFVDVGANVGVYSRPMSRRFDRVVAFEPNPETAELLRKGLLANLCSNVEVREEALSDHAGTAELFLSADPEDVTNGAATLFKGFRYHTSLVPDRVHLSNSSCRVKLSVFDHEFPSGLVDLVKIDVEGAEFDVLKGMSRCLLSRRIEQIILELHDNTRRSALASFLDGFEYYVDKWLDPDHALIRSPISQDT